MDTKMHRNNFLRRARILAVLLAAIFLVPALRAQPAEQAAPGRFLFIFDTSWAMRNRVEAVQKALDVMLATSLSGHLHTGDSIGVWTFSQDLSAGNYPLQTWDADKAVMIASNLMKFVGDQHYAKTARFEALQPLLNEVVQGSERLTVLIFCDGSVKAAGTPFDAGINQAFQDKQGDQSKAHQPFVVLLRSQLGKFTGCTISFPPATLNIPEFPPLPPPPPPPAPKPINPPPVVVSTVPSLFIVGTKVSTSMPPPEIISPPTNEPAPATVVPPPVAPVPPTNAPAPPPTNPVVAMIMPPAPPDNSGSDNKKILAVGAGLLGAVIVLGIIVWLRSHRKDTSLITRSMNDRR
jgi:hypothetical protein